MESTFFHGLQDDFPMIGIASGADQQQPQLSAIPSGSCHGMACRTDEGCCEAMVCKTPEPESKKGTYDRSTPSSVCQKIVSLTFELTWIWGSLFYNSCISYGGFHERFSILAPVLLGTCVPNPNEGSPCKQDAGCGVALDCVMTAGSRGFKTCQPKHRDVSRKQYSKCRMMAVRVFEEKNQGKKLLIFFKS